MADVTSMSTMNEPHGQPTSALLDMAVATAVAFSSTQGAWAVHDVLGVAFHVAAAVELGDCDGVSVRLADAVVDVELVADADEVCAAVLVVTVSDNDSDMVGDAVGVTVVEGDDPNVTTIMPGPPGVARNVEPTPTPET